MNCSVRWQQEMCLPDLFIARVEYIFPVIGKFHKVRLLCVIQLMKDFLPLRQETNVTEDRLPVAAER